MTSAVGRAESHCFALDHAVQAGSHERGTSEGEARRAISRGTAVTFKSRPLGPMDDCGQLTVREDPQDPWLLLNFPRLRAGR